MTSICSTDIALALTALPNSLRNCICFVFFFPHLWTFSETLRDIYSAFNLRKAKGYESYPIWKQESFNDDSNEGIEES